MEDKDLSKNFWTQMYAKFPEATADFDKKSPVICCRFLSAIVVFGYFSEYLFNRGIQISVVTPQSSFAEYVAKVIEYYLGQLQDQYSGGLPAVITRETSRYPHFL